jgi:hypothetical protein
VHLKKYTAHFLLSPTFIVTEIPAAERLLSDIIDQIARIRRYAPKNISTEEQEALRFYTQKIYAYGILRSLHLAAKYAYPLSESPMTTEEFQNYLLQAVYKLTVLLTTLSRYERISPEICELLKEIERHLDKTLGSLDLDYERIHLDRIALPEVTLKESDFCSLKDPIESLEKKITDPSFLEKASTSREKRALDEIAEELSALQWIPASEMKDCVVPLLQSFSKMLRILGAPLALNHERLEELEQLLLHMKYTLDSIAIEQSSVLSFLFGSEIDEEGYKAALLQLDPDQISASVESLTKESVQVLEVSP